MLWRRELSVVLGQASDLLLEILVVAPGLPLAVVSVAPRTAFPFSGWS